MRANLEVDMTCFETVYDLAMRVKHLGYERTPNDAQLFGFVLDSRFGFKRWVHFIFPALKDEEIDLIESMSGVKFPVRFRDFLKQTNGLILFSGALSIDGYCSSYDRLSKAAYPYAIEVPNTVERIKDAKPSFVFIGGYSSDGSKLYIDPETDRVYRCPRRTTVPINEWPDFDSMLNSEALRLSEEFESRNPGCYVRA